MAAELVPDNQQTPADHLRRSGMPRALAGGRGTAPSPFLAGLAPAGSPDGSGAESSLAARLREAVARQPHRGPDALGLVGAASVLWRRFLRMDPDDPHWPDRDRLVVGNARFAPLLRGLLTLESGAALADDSLFGFGQHPAVEMAVGPAGQGIATAAGMALAERLLAGRFGQSLVDHRTWVLACESDLSAGVALEAAAMAGQMRLDRLCVLFELEEAAGPAASAGDGALPLSRFAACGWSVRRVDADDLEAVAQALAGALRGRKPSLIACVVQRPAPQNGDPKNGAAGGGTGGETGGGATNGKIDGGDADCGEGRGTDATRLGGAARSGTQQVGRRPGRIAPGLLTALPNALQAPLLRSSSPLPLPSPLSSAPPSAQPPRGQAARRAWLKRLARHRMRDEFERVIAGHLPPGWLEGWRAAWTSGGRHEPGDSAVGRGLSALVELLPEFISLGCAARPLAAPLEPPSPGRPPRALDLGTQEHGMAALANGIALHGGLLPCGSASFIAIDRMRPALRLGALMRRQVIHLLTHDGLALGEDGAAWQPVEQLASLRAMPNVAVFRPADETEMAECWQLALHRRDGPSLIAVSPRLPPVACPAPRGPAPGARAAGGACARGGYLLAAPPAGLGRDVSLIATGPEIGIALAARDGLRPHGIGAAVVSLPCWELFALQAAPYRETVLGTALRVGLEAASGFGWERWLGPGGLFIGIEEFGVGAPADQLYRQFGLTAEAVCERIRQRLAISHWPPPALRP